MPRRPYGSDEDFNLLRLALLEQDKQDPNNPNFAPGRAPSGMAMNAYLSSIPRTAEQERETGVLDEMDRRYFQTREDERKRTSALDDAEGAAAIRNFETRRGVREDMQPPAFTAHNFRPMSSHGSGPALSPADAPKPRQIRRFTQSDKAIDPDTAMGARDRARLDPRVMAEETRTAGDIAIANAKSTLANTQADETAATKAEIIRLANEIYDHPALSRNVGPIDAAIPTFMGDSRDFEAKAQRLRDLLALESRGKLKGQGAVSDFEGRMLANSTSSLRQGTDEDAFRKELDRIITSQGGQSRLGGGGRKVGRFIIE